MEEMMAELEAELFSARREMRSLNKDLQKQLGDKPPPKEVVDPIRSRAPAPTIPKQKRFKEAKKEELSSSMFGNSVMSMDHVKQAKPAIQFPKSKRFNESKEKDQRAYNPNIDAVKKQGPKTSIAPIPKKKNMARSGVSQSELDELETQASMSQMGPGKYDPKFDQIESHKACGFGKDTRFKPTKVEEQSDINPDYNAVIAKAVVAKITVPTERNKQLLERDQMEQQLEEERARLYNERPVDLDAALRPAAPQTLIMKSFKDIAGAEGKRHRRFLLMKLIDELKFKTLGPGAYEAFQPKPAPCAVIYRPHSADGRRLPSDDEPVPGPDYYYSKDDLVKTKAIVHEFGKDVRFKKLKRDELDMKEPLDVKDVLTKPSAPVVGILPERQNFSKIPNEDDQIKERLGPGVYEPEMKLVEPRTDKGAVKMIEEKVDRVQAMDPVGRDREFHDYEEILIPSLDAVKPHVSTFQYHEPTIQEPPHIPDKELFPEKWQHYDVNLDATKEVLGKTVPHFGGKVGRGLIEFLRYQQHLDEFKEYLARESFQPEIGQYDIKYRAIDKEPKAVDFNRYIAKDTEPITKPEGFVPGDNLILNPFQLPQHFANLDFGKQLDRPAGPQPKEGPELIIEPNITAIKPRVKGIPDFQKQSERPQPPEPKETELIIEPQYTQVQARIKGHTDMARHIDREEDPRYVHKVDDRPLVVEPDQKLVKPKTKCLVRIDKSSQRFKQR